MNEGFKNHLHQPMNPEELDKLLANQAKKIPELNKLLWQTRDLHESEVHKSKMRRNNEKYEKAHKRLHKEILEQKESLEILFRKLDKPFESKSQIAFIIEISKALSDFYKDYIIKRKIETSQLLIDRNTMILDDLNQTLLEYENILTQLDKKINQLEKRIQNYVRRN
jgi:uncharacterized coiled-coil protein SlyX